MYTFSKKRGLCSKLNDDDTICMFRGESKTRRMRGKWEGKEWEAGRWEGRK